MPFSATVYNVLIASPSDVPDERHAIAQALHDWNALNAQASSMILQPVMWETHSAPAMGDRPQGIINHQVVRSCDILIGAFWTRLGSHTGVEESGTVEEIKWFLSNKKPVMLYFSKAQADLDVVDLDQLKKLKDFKVSIRDRGIQEDYRNTEELRTKLSRQLTIAMREVNFGPVIDRKGVEAVKASTRAEDQHSTPKSKKEISKKINNKTEIWLEDYTERAFTVCGNTSAYKDEFKEAGGKWITTRNQSKAWMFSKRRLPDIAKLLKIAPDLRESQP